MMRKILIVILALLAVQGVSAQSAKRRAEQAAEQERKSNKNQLSTRAQISFPTQAEMQEDVVWRRDVYREIDLTQDANAGLYYPVEPQGSQMNLFTYMFKLMLRGQIKAYDYDVNSGDALFDESLRVKPLEFLKKYEIYYERTDRGIHIDDSDIPSREVKAYFIKESSYYDQNTATFHTKVLALCPVMVRDDDFGDGGTKYPLFWVKYDDIAPFLARQTIMTSNLNNAATMSVDDYFTRNCYQGKIYKTTNMLGRTLAQYCPTDSAMAKEQARIEQELKDFEKNIFGNQQKNDSIDSMAAADDKIKGKRSVKNRRAGGTSKEKTSANTRRGRSSSSSAGSSARVSVRRQRH